MVLSVFTKYFDFIMIALILGNLFMRRYPDAKRKRYSFILWALDFLGIYALLLAVEQFQWPSWLEWVAIALGVVVAVIFRKSFWPYRLKCSKCGKKLNFREITTRDEALCDDCWYEEHPEEKKAKEEEAKKKSLAKPDSEAAVEELCNKAEKVEDVPWGSWEPTERCVLTYVMDGDKLLMILKKTGMGNGYWNAPGGHIELEETSREAAIRETKEETGLDISELKERGTLHFQFKSGIRMIGYVFTTTVFSGTLIDECDETKPFWLDQKDLDYKKMWADDPLWLPLLLEGKNFDGYFVFDDRTLLDSKVEIVEDDVQ